MNTAYAKLMGQSRESLLSENLHQHALKSADFQRECLHVLQTGGPTQREIQLTTEDGRELWLGLHLVPFDREDQRYVLVHLIDLSDHRRIAQELKQLAFHDSLTGLANRRLLWEHFHQTQSLCSRNQEWAAVLLLDLNRFKQLNDQHGHDAGDQMLQEVARRMQHTMRASDVIARLGGDEFALLLQGLGNSEEQAQRHAQVLCEKLQSVLAQPYQLGTISYQASASVGIAFLNPNTKLTLDDLLRQADTRMYAQKKSLAHADHTTALPTA